MYLLSLKPDERRNAAKKASSIRQLTFLRANISH